MVTYGPPVTDDDLVFRALADPTRRFLLDRLFARDGRTLGGLESELEMTRFGVMKHLRVLEDAELVVTRRSGRQKLHFLNPVPIRLIHDRWIDKYTERQVSALASLKTELEGAVMTSTTQETSAPVQIQRVYIRASAQAIWDAITQPEWTEKYGYGGRVEYDLRPGGAFRHGASPEMVAAGMPEVVVDGEVVEADPPTRLVQTWRARWGDEGFTRLTYDIRERGDGVASLTVTHDLTGAPQTAAMVGGGNESEGAGGGWAEVLSDLKTLLETGKALAG